MYSTTLLIEADDDTSIAGAQAWIEDVGQDYAPRYGKGAVIANDGKIITPGTYTIPPSDLAQIIWDECHRYGDEDHTVHFAATVAQMIHETAGFQSKYWRERWNPGGIGAINSNSDLAIRFPDPRSGVRSHIAHLLVYSAGTNGGWVANDPRMQAVVDKGWDGVTTRWVHLNGRWAFPGPTYGQGIITIANRLRDAAGGGTVAGDDSRFEWLEELAGEIGYPQGQRGRIQNRNDLPNKGKVYPIELGVLHITIGNDSLAHLRNANGNSAHYLTYKNGKPRAQMVRESDAAWAGGHYEYNLRGIQVEHEKRNLSDPWTDEMYTNLADVCYGISKRNSIPLVYLGKDNALGKRGWIGHSDIPDPDGSGWGGAGNHADPGTTFSWNKLIAQMRVLASLDDDTPPVEEKWIVPENPFGQFGFIAGFRDTAKKLAMAKFPQDLNASILSITGYPKEDEWAGVDGCSYQRCERNTLKWHPTDAAPFDIVLMLPDTPLPERKPT